MDEEFIDSRRRIEKRYGWAIDSLCELGIPSSVFDDVLSREANQLAVTPVILAEIAEIGNSYFSIEHTGLILGKKIRVQNIGPANLALGNSATLRSFIDNYNKFGAFAIGGLKLDLQEANDNAKIVLRFSAPSLGKAKNLYQIALSRLCSVIPGVLGDPGAILAVNLNFSSHDSDYAYRQYLVPDIVYDQPETCIVVAAEMLDRPISRKADSSKLNSLYQEKFAQLHYEEQMLARITEILRWDVKAAIDLEAIIEELHVSRRTLNRILQRCGTSYRDIRNEMVIFKAKKLLQSGDMTIAKVSETLGYSEPAAFNRAFKSSTQFSPGEYQKRHGS